MSNLDDAFRQAVEEVNKARHTNGGGIKPETRGYDTSPPVLPPNSVPPNPVPPNPVPPNPVMQPAQQHYDFERLGEQIAASLLQAAEEQLVQAQNMLAQTQAFAEDVKTRIADKARELADMNARLKAFGAGILEAHKRFHGEYQ